MSGNIFNSTAFVMSVDSPQKLAASQAEVAFVGRSNVGKSSLLNAVCGHRQLAKVSKTPGRTRAINVFSVRHGKWIVDLPGYGFAVGPEKSKEGWQGMIEGYLAGRDTLQCVFVLIDAKVGPTKLDRQMLLWLQSQGVPFCAVANKIDKIAQPQLEAQKQAIAAQIEIAPERIVWTSAEKGTGITELRSLIAELLGVR